MAKEKKADEKQPVEAARVAGMKVEKVGVDEILENIDLDQDVVFKILDKDLTKEISDSLSGHFSPDLIYNKPFSTDGGRVDHGHVCDVMNYGRGCSYRDRKQKHIHVVGVGYMGALTALRAYGQMSVKVEQCPELNDAGGDLTWFAYAEATDHHTNITIGRWYGEKLMLATRKGSIEKEHAMSIAQSKAMRNVILALLPKDLMAMWIADYKAGKKAFNPDRTQEMGYNKQRQQATNRKDTPPKQQTTTPSAGKAQKDIVDKLATKMGLATPDLEKFLADIYDTAGKITLNANRALSDDELRASMRSDYDSWLAPEPEEPPGTNADRLDDQQRKHNPPE